MYTVYKTTNLHNEKFYIGVHKTSDPYDDYLGSGKHLKYAIRKYGSDSFSKEILLVTEDSVEAFTLEASLVTPAMVADPMCYNLKLGGEGGFDLINSRDQSERNRKIANMAPWF